MVSKFSMVISGKVKTTNSINSKHDWLYHHHKMIYNRLNWFTNENRLNSDVVIINLNVMYLYSMIHCPFFSCVSDIYKCILTLVTEPPMGIGEDMFTITIDNQFIRWRNIMTFYMCNNVIFNSWIFRSQTLMIFNE